LITGTAWHPGRCPFYGTAAFYFPASPEKEVQMNVKLYVGNLPKTITQLELTTMFTRAGEVIVTDLITERNSSESKGFAFVTMSTQSEAEKAIHMFNAYSLNKQELKVNMAKLPYRL
jgi:RNA recognition motif-containing protein